MAVQVKRLHDRDKSGWWVLQQVIIMRIEWESNWGKLTDEREPTLESVHEEICEEQGYYTERAKIFRAAIKWSKKHDKIDELKQKAQKVLYSYSGLYTGLAPWDYTEVYESRSSLEFTIRDVMTRYYNDSDVMTEYNHDWGEDYEFQLESLLRYVLILTRKPIMQRR